MRHLRDTVKLKRTSAHRRAMFNNMVTSLFRYERIKTTLPKAKQARRVAERLVTLAKKGTLHARRLASRRIKEAEVLKKLFDVLGPRYASRNGGYTRIYQLGARGGDGAEMAFLEMVDRIVVAPSKPKGKEKKKAAEPSEEKP